MLKRKPYYYCRKCHLDQIAIKIGKSYYCSSCYFKKFGREVKVNEYAGHLAGKNMTWYCPCELCKHPDIYGKIIKENSSSYICLSCWEFLSYYI